MAWDPEPRARSPQEQLGYDVIGRLLARRRRGLGWTQRYLEHRSGIDQPVISRLENGKQFGMRWARFAALVGSMGGLGDEPYPRDLPDPSPPRPLPSIDLLNGAAPGLGPHDEDMFPAFEVVSDASVVDLWRGGAEFEDGPYADDRHRYGP